MRQQLTYAALLATLFCPSLVRAAPSDSTGWFSIAGVGLMKLSHGHVDAIDPPPSDSIEVVEPVDGGARDASVPDPGDAALQAQQQRIPELIAAQGNEAWTLSPAGIGHVQGTAIQIEWANLPGSLHLAIALDASGTPWVLTSDAVAHRLGPGHWQIENYSEVGLKLGHFRDLAVDMAGDVWLATSDGLRRHDTSGWHAFAIPGSQRLLRVATHGNNIAVLSSDQLVRIRGMALVSHTEIPHRWVNEELISLVMDSAQNVFLATHGGTLARISPSGEITTWTARWDLQAMSLRAIAVDDQDRLWIATDTGFVLLSGKQLSFHTFATVPDLAGPMQSIALAGSGFDLPTPVPSVKLDVTGIIVLKGVPAPKIDLLLCPTPSDASDDPCDGSPFRLQATTDDKGTFTFPGVPAGAYGLAWRAPKAQLWNLLGDSRAVRSPGPVDLGSLIVQ